MNVFGKPQNSASASALQHTATHCNTLQHTATHGNTLQHTATHDNTRQHTATHCNTRQHTATHCNTRQHNALQRASASVSAMGWLRSVGARRVHTRAIARARSFTRIFSLYPPHITHPSQHPIHLAGCKVRRGRCRRRVGSTKAKASTWS